MHFELWRQDDHGNRYLVGTFDDRVAAEKRMDEMTRVLHKQTYWIVSTQAPVGKNAS